MVDSDQESWKSTQRKTDDSFAQTNHMKLKCWQYLYGI